MYGSARSKHNHGRTRRRPKNRYGKTHGSTAKGFSGGLFPRAGISKLARRIRSRVSSLSFHKYYLVWEAKAELLAGTRNGHQARRLLARGPVPPITRTRR